MAQEIWMLFMSPLAGIWQSFVSTIPNMVAALVFLLIGLTLARIATTIIQNALRKIPFDQYTSQIGINEMLARLGFGKSPSIVITFVAYWTIILIFILLASNALELQIVTEILKRFMVFVPKLLVGILILFGGLLFARFAHDVVLNSATANNLKGGVTLAKAVNMIVIFFASVMAIEQLGIAMNLIMSLIQIFIASVGVAFALALGLGAKDIVAEYLKNALKKQE